MNGLVGQPYSERTSTAFLVGEIEVVVVLVVVVVVVVVVLVVVVVVVLVLVVVVVVVVVVLVVGTEVGARQSKSLQGQPAEQFPFNYIL